MTSDKQAFQSMFNGSFVALVTPFTEQGEIDFPALRQTGGFSPATGFDGLVIAGTTGESVSLSQAEFCAVLDHVVAQVSAVFR